MPAQDSTQTKTVKLGVIRSARWFLHACKILAVDHGYWQSIRRQCAVAADGSPLPWYTYASIEYLRSFDFSEADVFEYGAGSSSEFWAMRARRVVSVEDNQEWYSMVSRAARENQKVMFCPDEQGYVHSISLSNQKYRVVVVDGKWRDLCVRKAITHLREDGLLLLDNSDRTPEICEHLRRMGFFQIDFNGPGPINRYCWTTSIFIHAPNVPQQGYVPPLPVGRLVPSI
jgi:hypothetical protein